MPPPITLPRRTLHGFRTVLKKHLDLKGRDPGPPVRLHADDAGGTRLTARGPDGRGVSLHVPGDRPPNDLILPFALLANAGAAKAGDATLADADGGNAVVANWDERGVPRTAREILEKNDRDRAATFAVPEITDWRDPGPGFGGALRTACEVTDADSPRYALGCVRLDPHAGRVEATDSHHLLIARGFSFPFGEPVLLPAPGVLAAAPLRGDDVAVGVVTGGKSSAAVVALRCGDWTVWSPEVRDAQFPELDRVVPAGDGKASVALSAADAAFLLDRLPGLPGSGDERRPVTLEAARGVLLVRAADDGGVPVELATGSSAVRGETVCVADRRFLARGLAAGCTALALNGPEEPVRMATPASGPGGVTVVFATLAGDAVPAKDAVRVAAEPAAAETAAAFTDTPHAPAPVREAPPTATPRRTIPITPANRLNGHAANGRATDGPCRRGRKPAAEPRRRARTHRRPRLDAVGSRRRGSVAGDGPAETQKAKPGRHRAPSPG